MKKVISLILLLSIVGKSWSQTYSPVGENSKIKFTIKNFGIGTGGEFKGTQGAIIFDPNNLSQSSFEVSVDAKTIDTDINSRDNHLRKAEYFDVEKYPKLSFKSTKVSLSNKPGILYISGILTIKAVSKEISFPFTATPKDGGYLFEGTFKINRRDFGVGGSSISIGDNLTVKLSVFGAKK